jgi:hypothetical protein
MSSKATKAQKVKQSHTTERDFTICINAVLAGILPLTSADRLKVACAVLAYCILEDGWEPRDVMPLLADMLSVPTSDIQA